MYLQCFKNVKERVKIRIIILKSHSSDRCVKDAGRGVSKEKIVKAFANSLSER